jgi:cephalosporin hydroxylase
MGLEKLKNSARKRVRKLYNFFIDLKPRPPLIPATLKEFNEIQELGRRRSATNEHIVTLFLESLLLQPKLIVELGVARGGSTYIFERVAALSGATLVSVDINDCSRASAYQDWHFIHKDDIEFAREFPAWCRERNIEPNIDILFIDTSHYYEHTVQEIEHYFPLLSEKAKVFFHDTNINNFFFRRDGSIDLGWDNERGVIRAIEDFFHRRFNEKIAFTTIINGWLIKHDPYCCGFTILEKIPSLGG